MKLHSRKQVVPRGGGTKEGEVKVNLFQKTILWDQRGQGVHFYVC